MSMTMAKDLFLCGDIGGTNSRLRLFEVDSSAIKSGSTLAGTLIAEHQYENENFASFEDIVEKFLKESAKGHPKVACFAIAGPVDQNRVKLTNRANWNLDGEILARELDMKKVRLINDFLAIGYGILTLEDKDLVTLNDVPATPGAPIACIGAGTGLGECYLTSDRHGAYTAWPSEGGHSEFAPRNALEIDLLEFLKKRFEAKHRVSVERVISGHGIANVYDFLRDRPEYKPKLDKTMDSAVMGAGDKKAMLVFQNASKGNALCMKAMELFFEAYGSEAGVAGLKWMPFGGLYIAGGIAPKNIEALKKSRFMESFRDKGRVSPILNKVPVKVIMTEDVGQRGAEYVALQLLQEEQCEEAKAKKDSESMKRPCCAPSPIPTPAVPMAATCPMCHHAATANSWLDWSVIAIAVAAVACIAVKTMHH